MSRSEGDRDGDFLTEIDGEGWEGVLLIVFTLLCEFKVKHLADEDDESSDVELSLSLTEAHASPTIERNKTVGISLLTIWCEEEWVFRVKSLWQKF